MRANWTAYLTPAESTISNSENYAIPYYVIVSTYWKVKRSRYSDSLWAGRSGSNPGGGRDFPHPPRPALGPIQPPIQWVLGLFPGGKAAGAWRWPPTPSSAEVKERVEIYLYSTSGPSWPILGWTLPCTFYGKVIWPFGIQIRSRER